MGFRFICRVIFHAGIPWQQRSPLSSSSSLLLSSLEFGDAKVYEPQIRALRGTVCPLLGRRRRLEHSGRVSMVLDESGLFWKENNVRSHIGALGIHKRGSRKLTTQNDLYE